MVIHGIMKIGNKMEWIIEDSRQDLEVRLAERIKDILTEAIEKRGQATLLVSGGSTPLGLFNKLSQIEIDWSRVNISLADDRLNPDYSNETMVKEQLLKNQAEKANFITLLNREGDAIDAGRVIERLTSFKDKIDCVILGMGTDGHTASIFPGNEASEKALLDDNPSEIVVYTKAPKVPIERISFMPKTLMDASNIFIHIFGEEKKKLLSNIASNKEELNLPIGYFTEDTPKVKVYYAD